MGARVFGLGLGLTLGDPGIGDSSAADASDVDMSGDGGDACRPLEGGGTKGGGEDSPLELDS